MEHYLPEIKAIRFASNILKGWYPSALQYPHGSLVLEKHHLWKLKTKEKQENPPENVSVTGVAGDCSVWFSTSAEHTEEEEERSVKGRALQQNSRVGAHWHLCLAWGRDRRLPASPLWGHRIAIAHSAYIALSTHSSVSLVMVSFRNITCDHDTVIECSKSWHHALGQRWNLNGQVLPVDVFPVFTIKPEDLAPPVMSRLSSAFRCRSCSSPHPQQGLSFSQAGSWLARIVYGCCSLGLLSWGTTVLGHDGLENGFLCLGCPLYFLSSCYFSLFL